MYMSVIPYLCVSNAMSRVRGTEERRASHLLIVTILPIFGPPVTWPAALNFFAPTIIITRSFLVVKGNEQIVY